MSPIEIVVVLRCFVDRRGGRRVDIENPPQLLIVTGSALDEMLVLGDMVNVLECVEELGARQSGQRVLLDVEVYNVHPAKMYVRANAVAAALERGVQVVTLTHSLEWIDALLNVVDEELDVALCRFARVVPGYPNAGQIAVERFNHSDLRSARAQNSIDVR